MTARIAAPLVLLALGACSSAPPPAPAAAPAPPPPVAAPAPAPPTPAAPAAPTPAEQRTAAASALAVERQWLAAWFKGTPVVIAQRANGAVVVEVPREFCFEPGRDAIKPALAAVLDKVAQSMRRTPSAELQLIAAPGDNAASAALGLRRAVRVHEHLRSRGVSETRMAKPSAASGAAVQLRIDAAAPA
jgi:outer membrane protein OmpA-like peptidoglycan-associated protein